MKTKNLLLTLFIAVALIQAYVPAKMILDREAILAHGKAFKFKTAPIDPNDPFRGKYLTLDFEQSRVKVKSSRDWTNGQTVYLGLEVSPSGFAEITSVSKKQPENTSDFLKAKVSSSWSEDGKEISVDLPFDRYYMDETKAYDAEISYRKATVDSSQIAYALVMIKEGESVLKDLRINERSVKDLVKK